MNTYVFIKLTILPSLNGCRAKVFLLCFATLDFVIRPKK